MRAVWIALFVVAVMGLAACGDDENGGGSDSTIGAPVPGDETTEDTGQEPADADPLVAAVGAEVARNLREGGVAVGLSRWNVTQEEVEREIYDTCNGGADAIRAFIRVRLRGATLLDAQPVLNLAQLSVESCPDQLDEGEVRSAVFAQLSSNDFKLDAGTKIEPVVKGAACDVLELADDLRISEVFSRLVEVLSKNRIEVPDAAIGLAVNAAVTTCPLWIDSADALVREYLP